LRRLAQLLVCIVAGFALAWLVSADVPAIAHAKWYQIGAYALLAVGLYGATFGIDLRQARNDKKIIVTAVTVGVVVKALIIGGTLALAWQNPLFLILGVAVAQIDPLSVASLMNDGRMSVRARNVLAAWSSFDDPFTVLLSIYAAAVAVNTFGLGSAEPSSSSPALLYGLDLGGNLLLAGVAWVIWRFVRGRTAWEYTALALFAVAAVLTGWMLAIALIGLFARPHRLEHAIGKITQVALFTAAVALGFLLIDGIALWQGISLGILAFVAQMIVSPPLTRKMPLADRWHLATAQQNGITAIILALTLEIQFDGVVAVVAPAIVTVNLIHAGVNSFADRRLLNRAKAKTPS
jgi:hypothetical protein